jgi:hypothetical protein
VILRNDGEAVGLAVVVSRGGWKDQRGDASTVLRPGGEFPPRGSGAPIFTEATKSAITSSGNLYSGGISKSW